MQFRLMLERCAEMGAELVEANGGLKALSPFAVEFFCGPDLPCDVELIGEIQDGLAVCTSLLLKQAPGGAPINSAILRLIPVHQLEGCAYATITAPDEEDLRNRMRSPEKRDRIVATLRSRKHRITTELLSQVADTYAAAIERGEYPIPAIRDRWNVSRSTAAAWVGLARKHEPPLLAPSKKGTEQ